MASAAIELTFTKEKETKNTVRYKEDVAEDETALVGNLYVQKAAAKDLPENVKVTIVGA
jgi:hypothetical protein